MVIGSVAVYIVLKKPFIELILLVAGVPIFNPIVRSGIGFLSINWSKIMLMALFNALPMHAEVKRRKLPQFDDVFFVLFL